MILGEATVTRVYGHAEAQKLVAHCMRYDSEITMELGTKKINGKSLMGVISMALKPGDTVTIIAKGDDQEQATADIVRILAQ